MIGDSMAFLFVTIIFDHILKTYLQYFTLNWWHMQQFGNEIQPSCFWQSQSDFFLKKAKIAIDND